MFKGSNNTNSDDGGCYIATMVYGSYNATEVKILRQFRDKFLLKHSLGVFFVKNYYSISPTIVNQTKHVKVFHVFVKLLLNPMIRLLQIKYENNIIF